MSNISCSKHAPNTQFFIMYWDFLRITRDDTRDNYAQAAGLRVLETKTNDRLTYLQESGRADHEITEEDLWLTLRWCDFASRSLHLYEERSFQAALPGLIRKGFVRQRYVKVDATNTVICDEETGCIIAYPDIKSARHDLAHRGEIVNQFLLVTEAVNRAVDRLTGSSPLPPDRDPGGNGGGEGDEHGGAGEEKNTEGNTTGPHGGVTSSQQAELTPPRGTIQQGSQNCEGIHKNMPDSPTSLAILRASAQAQGAQNCEPPSQKYQEASQNCEPHPRKIASNNNITGNKNLEESLLISAAGAGVSPFDFSREWSVETILDLAARILPPLPPRYKSPTDQEAKTLAWRQAAERLAADAFLREAGLRHLARLMAYMSDPSSPCRWHRHILANNPGVVVRLWHLPDNAWRVSQEMEASGWWPTWLQPNDSPAPAEEDDGSREIDLADLAGIARDARRGMDQDTTRVLVERILRAISDYLPEARVDWQNLGNRFQRDRGCIVDFWTANGQMIRLYSLEDWDLVVSESAYLDDPTFEERLVSALREDQAA